MLPRPKEIYRASALQSGDGNASELSPKVGDGLIFQAAVAA
jgi:hypothetical protein